MDQLGKIRQNHRKARLKLVKLPSLKVIRLKRAKIELCKDAKIYRRLRPTTQPPEKFRHFEELYVSFKGAFSSRVDEFFLPCPCQKLKKQKNKKKKTWKGLLISLIYKG